MGIWDHFGPFVAAFGCFGPFWAVLILKVLLPTFTHSLVTGPCWAVLGHFGPHLAILRHFGPFKAVLTILGHFGSF